MVLPDTDTLTSIPSSLSPSSPWLLSCEEPGIGEPPSVEAVPRSLDSVPDEELDEELLDDLLEEGDGIDAVDPGEPGIEGIEADDDDEELGIDGADEDDDDGDELGIDGGEDDDDGDELGIDGGEDELELDCCVDSQPASTRPSITALASALIGGKGLLIGILHVLRCLQRSGNNSETGPAIVCLHCSEVNNWQVGKTRLFWGWNYKRRLRRTT
jgi:hypothetical protein